MLYLELPWRALETEREHAVVAGGARHTLRLAICPSLVFLAVLAGAKLGACHGNGCKQHEQQQSHCPFMHMQFGAVRHTDGGSSQSTTRVVGTATRSPDPARHYLRSV